jgi:formylmethanofuran dehydrogenase subunit E
MRIHNSKVIETVWCEHCGERQIVHTNVANKVKDKFYCKDCEDESPDDYPLPLTSTDNE